MVVHSLRTLALACVTFLVLLAVPALSQTPPPAAPAPALSSVKYTFNGYVQGRYSDLLGDNIPGAFDAKRAYVNLRADINEHIAAGMMVTGVPKVAVLEAFGEYKFNPEFKARLGLYRIPFGYELPISSSRLITLERSQVTSVLLVNDFTFDRGLFTYYSKQPFNFSAALVNGNIVAYTSPYVDPDKRKNVVARAGYDIPGGQVGASIYQGTAPDSVEMNRAGVDMQLNRGNFTLIGEALTGEGIFNSTTGVTADVNTRGAYATLAYQQPASPWQPYLRLDTFDPDTDTADNNFRRATVGVNYYSGKNARFTAEYQSIGDESKPSIDGNIGLQYQVSF